MVLADSHGVPRVPWYLGAGSKEPNRFRLRGCYPLWPNFPEPSTNDSVSYSSTPMRRSPIRSRDTDRATLARLTHDRFRLFPFRSPLLRESRLLSLPGGTEMVHFPPLAPSPLWIQGAVTGLFILPPGFPIRASPGRSMQQLTGAYRSLRRPSSPSSAKASTMRPY